MSATFYMMGDDLGKELISRVTTFPKRNRQTSPKRKPRRLDNGLVMTLIDLVRVDERNQTLKSNIEIKARLHSPSRQRDLAIQLAGCNPEILNQRDTFFHVENGRLKLREMAGSSELIHYFRANDSAARRSDYVISPVQDADSLFAALKRAQGVRGVVKKSRQLWRSEQTRIHFDDVVGLGEFVELEFVMNADQSEEEGRRQTASIMERLQIRDIDLVECAYIDLLEQQNFEKSR